MSTAIYSRISDDRADRAGVERQLLDCRALCKRREWVVDPAHEYVDNSISASKSSAKRPAYQSMLTAVRAGDVDRIVVWMIDRLYRQPRELEDLIDLCINGKVEVYSTHSGEGIDLSSPDGATMARVSVAFAAGESRKISVRVKRQQADRRAKGYHHGATRPLGYERQLSNGVTHFVPVPAEVSTIVEAMRSVLGGKSLADVAHQWTADGVAHPQKSRLYHGSIEHVYPWSAQSVATILRSPRNIGRMTNRAGQDIGPGEWPAIVSSELFEQYNATIAARRTRGTSPNGPRGMLTGLIHCGVCDANMHRGRNARGPYYRCAGDDCGKVAIKAEFVEELTLAALRERLSGHHFRLGDERPPKESHRLHEIGMMLMVIDRRIEDLATVFADDVPRRGSRRTLTAWALRRSADMLAERQDKLIVERDALRAVSPVKFLGNIDDVLRDWDTFTADQKHNVLEAVLGKVTIAHVGRGKWPVETMRRRVTFGI